MSGEDRVQLQDVGVIELAWAGGVPAITSQVGFSAAVGVVDNGVGDVTLTLPAADAIPAAVNFSRIKPNTALFAAASMEDVAGGDLAKRIRVFDAAGMALDNIPLQIVFTRRV